VPLAAGGGRSIYALFAHMHFAKGENFAWAIKFCFNEIEIRKFLFY